MPRKKNVILRRAAEPSTHAGLAGIAQAIGYFFPEYALIANAATAVFGAIAAIKADRHD